MNRLSHRKRHHQGYLFGIIFGLAALLFFLIPSSEKYFVNGPMVPGHEALECLDCHKEELGTLRQQLQANALYLLNLRKKPVSVGLRPAQNSECLDCHQRPNDRHPVYRFLEPKYRKVREKIGADSCIACHLEHKGNRVSVQTNFCKHCHDELKLKNDPVDIPHQQLVSDKRWKSCLGCHDFHGNHEMKPENKIKNVIALTELENYFNHGDDPFPGKKIHKAINNDKK